MGKSKILIVDDSVLNIQVLGEILKNDYEVYFCKESLKAVDTAKSKNVDLILLDVIMPDMDGYEVCRALKNDEETKNIPVIFVTSRDKDEDEERGLAAGAIDYIAKPFSAPIVQARVRNHIRLKNYQDLLEENSMRDSLTGLYNKGKLNEVLRMEYERALRGKLPISLLLIDIDFFKKYNDNYGHLQGDECLKEVAKNILSQMKRPGDIAARFGGEEFACILSDTDRQGAMNVALAIKKSIEDLNIPHEYSEVAGHVSVSIGGAGGPASNFETIEELFQQADKCLYEAKESGRNRISLK